MTKKLLFVFTILLAVAFVAAAADVSGKWTYEQPGRGGGDPFTVTITLKADGAALTGTILGGGGGRGRKGGGGAPAPVDISDGKVDGNTVTFTVKREGPNGTMTTSYKGKLDGDTLQLEITRPGRNGGEPVTNKFTAKRAATM